MIRFLLACVAVLATVLSPGCTNCADFPGMPDNCGSKANTGGPQPPPIPEVTYPLTCNNGGCDAPYFELTTAEIRSCFSEYNINTNLWQFLGDAPYQVTGNCNPNLTYPCRVYMADCGEVPTTADPNPVCVGATACAAAGSTYTNSGGQTYTTSDGRCTWDFIAVKAAQDATLASTLGNLDATKHCTTVFAGRSLGVPFHPVMSSSCSLATECDVNTAAKVWMPGTTKSITLTQNSSWVKLTRPGNVTTIPLHGSLAVKVAGSTKQFLAGRVYADPFTFYGVTMSGGRVAIMGGPINYTTGSGTVFTVSAAQAAARVDGIITQGTSHPGPFKGWMSPTGNGAGHLSATAFDYDYTQNWTNNAGDTVVVVAVHLVGTVQPVTP